MQRKLNLRIYDVYATLAHPNTNNTPLQEHLITSNLGFFNHEITQITDEKFDTVILGETRPAHPVPPFQHTLPILQQHFQNALACKVVFDPFSSTLSDNAKKALANIAAIMNDGDYTQEQLDAHSIPDYIALMCRANACHPEEKITVNIYTDSSEKNRFIDLFFLAHPDIIPDNVTKIELANYDDNQIAFYEPDHIALTGQGETNLSFSSEEEKKMATAYEFKTQGLLPAELVPTQELTNKLLASAQQAAQTAELITTSAVPAPTAAPTPATASTPTAAAPTAAPAKAPSPPEFVIPKEVENKAEALLKSYCDREISMTQYLKFQLHRYTQTTSPTVQLKDPELLMNILHNIASLPKWEEKGKRAIPFFLARKVPDSVNEIKEHKGDIAALAKTLQAKLDDWLGSKARSHMTTDFYQLIVGINNPELSQLSCLQGIKAFCKKWEINYDIVSQPIPTIRSASSFSMRR